VFRGGETSRRAKRFLATTLLAVAVMTAAIVSTAVVGIGAAGASSALGTPHPATLPAVTIGLISDTGSGGGGTGALVEQGAKAAVAYENKYQDGLEGHKIDLYICENQATPAGGHVDATDFNKTWDEAVDDLAELGLVLPESVAAVKARGRTLYESAMASEA